MNRPLDAIDLDIMRMMTMECPELDVEIAGQSGAEEARAGEKVLA